jgi:predicted permease
VNLVRKLRTLFRQEKLDRDMAEEMRFHLAQRAADHVDDGMSPDEAPYAAQRKFGNVASIQEQARAQRSWVWFELLTKDFRFALRVLARQRGTTTVALLTLALCLGANAALFSLVRSTLLQPYPYPAADRVCNLGMVWMKSPWGDLVQEISPRVFLDLQETATSFESLGFIEAGTETDLHWSGQTIRLKTASVTPGVWETTRVAPLLGRTFSSSDLAASGNGLVVLSHGLWHRFFNGAPGIVGAKVRLDDHVCEVIGVMPHGFSVASNQIQLWRPKIFSAAERSEQSRGSHGFQAIGRLNEGVTLEQARQELAALHRAYVAQNPGAKTFTEQWGETYGAASLTEWVRDRAAAPMFFSVQVAAGLVLLLGCLNITGLVVVQAHRRVGELSLRHAFGATRWRLARQFAIETMMLFVLGGLLAAWVGRAALEFLRVHFHLEQTTPFGQPAEFGWSMLAVTLAAAVFAGLLAGIVPAVFAARRDVTGAIQAVGLRTTGGRGRRWSQSGFVVMQVALALVLVTTSAVTTRNLQGLIERGFGLAVEDRIVVKIALPEYRYGTGIEATTARINPFKEQAIAALAALPGVRSVTGGNRVPLSSDQPLKFGFHVPGYTPGPGEGPTIALVYHVQPGFFQTLGIALLRGRDFDFSDRPGTQPSVVITAEIARKYFQETDPLGSALQCGGREFRIIGVVNDTRGVPLNFGDAPALYFPVAQWPAPAEESVFVVQTEAQVAGLAPAITRTLLALDPQLSVTTTTMADVQDRAVLTQSMLREVAGIFAALSVVLMSLGLYGVLANLATQRTREFGIRIALGASRGSVFGLVLGWGGRLAVLGLGLGLLLCVPALRWMKPLMVEANATEPVILVAAGGLILAVTLFASYWPARRATKVDPVVVLRAE